MKLTIGSAPDSWGIWFPSDPRQTPWWRFLDEVREAGYDDTELGPYGYLPTDLAVVRGEFGRRGLSVTARRIAGRKGPQLAFLTRPSAFLASLLSKSCGYG